MISTGAFLNEMDASNKQPTVAEKFAAVWEKKNAKAARAGGVSLMALSLAACGSSSDDSTPVVDNDDTSDGVTVTPIASAFTNGSDSGVGTAGDDEVSAGLVYTPGGNDRINSLQDEDVVDLGDGADTLNATLGNSNDNGATTVTPKIDNVETVNVAFTGSGSNAVDQLDLQDTTDIATFNITRVSDGVGNLIIDNAKASMTTLGIANSEQPDHTLDFAYDDEELSGGSDVASVNLDNVDVAGLIIDERGTADQGFETINMKTVDAASEIDLFTAEDLVTLNISGDADLTIAGTAVSNESATVANPEATLYTAGMAQVSGSLTTVDANGLDASLTLAIGGEINAGLQDTSGVPVQMTVTGGGKDDHIILTDGATVGGAATNTDTIDAGEGTDTLTVVGSAAINATTAGGNLAGFENLEIRTGHDDDDGAAGAGTITAVADTVTIDLDAFDTALASTGNFITIRNEGTAQDNGAGGFLSTAEDATVTLTDLSAQQAGALKVLHGTTGNNGFDDLVVNADVKVASGTDDTVAVTIAEGINTDVRFNFTLNANPAVATENVENITIADTDTESNTVILSDFQTHTGTIIVSGGEAGDFINLDADATTVDESGFYNYDQTGAATDGVGVTDEGNNANMVRLGAATINAADAVSDVIVRVDTNDASAVGAQSITMGAGDDTVIFDVLSTNTTVGASTATAGLTISDTVAGGTGADTLVLDGDGVDVRITASEWTNVSGLETLHLAGNGQADDNGRVETGSTNAYQITLSNTYVADNAANGTRIAIVNDNGAANAATGAVSANDGATIIATALDATHNFSYDGQETNALANPTTATADRFVFSDVNMNANAVIDGGAIVTGTGTGTATAETSTGGTDAGHLANADILEIQNSAVVSIGDLSGISNVSNIEATNTLAVDQTVAISLNNTVVDAMVNSTAAISDQATTAISAADRITDTHEILTITAIDNGTISDTLLNLDGSGVTNGAAWLNVTGAGGADVITTGGGADFINGNGGADTITTGGGADIVEIDAVADSAASVAADTNVTFDVITDFTSTVDQLDVVTVADALAGGDATGVTVTTLTTGGASLNDTTLADFAELKVAVDAVGLTASAAGAAGGATGLQAYIIDLTGNTGALGTGTYLVLNNADVALTAADVMVQLTGGTDPIAGDFII